MAISWRLTKMKFLYIHKPKRPKCSSTKPCSLDTTHSTVSPYPSFSAWQCPRCISFTEMVACFYHVQAQMINSVQYHFFEIKLWRCCWQVLRLYEKSIRTAQRSIYYLPRNCMWSLPTHVTKTHRRENTAWHTRKTPLGHPPVENRLCLLETMFTDGWGATELIIMSFLWRLIRFNKTLLSACQKKLWAEVPDFRPLRSKSQFL